MKRPNEIEFTGYVSYARALEEYCDYLEAQRTEQTSAERTLQNLGYTNNGGEYWKPPLVEQCKREVWRWHDLSLHDIKSAIEAKVKEKNT
jgi:hypothetical protein